MRTAPLQGYHDPKAAISLGLGYNSKNRTIPDSEVSGKKIRAVLWSDTALVFELDDGRFLSVVARDDHVICSLSEIKEEINGELDESILLDLGGGEFHWDRDASRLPMSGGNYTASGLTPKGCIYMQ